MKSSQTNETMASMITSTLKDFVKSKIFVLLFVLAIIVIIFAAVSGGRFLSPPNIRHIFQATVVVSLLTIGSGTLLIAGHIDLSLGGIGTMCAMMAAYLMRLGLPWHMAMLAAIVLGGIAGAFNAVLVNEFRFPSFIATLATATITQGFVAVISQGRHIDIRDNTFNFIGGARIINDMVPISLIISLTLLVIYGVMLKNTKFGRTIYLIGGNAEAAHLAGVRKKRISYILFINAAALSALAGMLLAGRMMTANVVGISASQFMGLTAAILGGISFGGGTGGMGGALLGILILSSVNNGMTVINIPPHWQSVVQGAVLLFALAADFVSTRRAGRNLGVHYGN